MQRAARSSSPTVQRARNPAGARSWTGEQRPRSKPRSLPPAVPRASRGPFGVTLVEHSGDEASAYRIDIVGLDGRHSVFRRYSHFANLRAQMLTSGLAGGASLPALPPKSFFRKNFSAKFRFERAACLRHVFKAVMEVDPLVTTEGLSEFLALGKPSLRRQMSRSQLRSELHLSAVSEGIEGDYSLLFASSGENAEHGEVGEEGVGQPEEAATDVSVKKLAPSRPSRVQRVGARIVVLART